MTSRSGPESLATTPGAQRQFEIKHTQIVLRLSDFDRIAQFLENFQCLLKRNLRILQNFSEVIRNPGGIPQYEMGHLPRVTAIEDRLAKRPGLAIAGNSLHGVSVNLCIENAVGTAERMLEFLKDSAESTATRRVR